jgi:hypothetical protein
MIRTYFRRIRPWTQAELDWFIRQQTIRDATKNAALARNSSLSDLQWKPTMT